MAIIQNKSLSFLALFCIATTLVMIRPAHALTLFVGGSEGWVLDPPEPYNDWAARMRFTVNDTLYFRYDAVTDSVLEVNEADYDDCNVNNPILRLEDGSSTFTLNHSGPYHFISGNKSHCDQGQKLLIIVLSDHKPHAHPPSPASSPPAASSSSAASPAPLATVSPAPAPASSSTTTIPSDTSAAPAPAPAHSSARGAFDGGSTVSFVMISLALVGLIGRT